MQLLDAPHHVVVWDPTGEYWEGGVVDAQAAKRLEARGVVLLPTYPDHFRVSGAGGYARRGWGAGLPLNNMAPAHVAPIVLYVHPEVRGLSWVARLVPDVRPDGTSPQKREGMVRFVSDSGQRFPMRAAYTELADDLKVRSDVLSFGDPDEHGGWTVRGRGYTSSSGEGHYGFSLHATAPGLRVAWLAAATCPIRM